jgi:glycosyltransferase involved in cell wall biosynthesis
MVIGFNAKAAFTQERTGVDEYVFWFIKTLINKGQNFNHQFIFYTDKLLKTQTLEDIFGEKLPDFIKIKVIPSKYLWTQGRLAYELYKNPPDVFFTPAHVLPLTTPPRSVITIHDLAFLYYPELYNPFSPLGLHYLKSVTQNAVKRAAKIIAVSENTKNDLVNLLNVHPTKIFTIYHGAPQANPSIKKYQDISFEQNDKFKEIFKNPYILFIGRIELKKNLKNLIRAFNLFTERFRNDKQKDVNLVLTGNPGYGYREILKFINQSPFKQNIFLTGHLQGQDKELILSKAKVLALISYYEGFGFPVLEAQSLGVPVVCSSVSSLPEVAGYGALYCRPDDINSIAKAFWDIFNNDDIALKLIKKGFENVKRFSWEKCVDETLEVLLNWP